MPAPINIAGTATPLMLYAGSVLLTSTPGSVGEFDPLKIRNPNNTPMWIDQFRFVPIGTASSTLRDALIQYSINISLGSIPVTKNYVTLGALTQRYCGPNAGFVGTARVPQIDEMVTYHLPKPLYVPPGVQVNVRVLTKQAPLGTGVLVTSRLHLTVAGRSILRSVQVPARIDVPWVAETRCDTAGLSTFVSHNNDLSAPNESPLQMTGFNGYNLNSPVGGGEIIVPNRSPLTVQMTGSNGTQFIRDPTPFQMVFPYDRGFFACRTQLQPGEFITAELNVNEQPTDADDAMYCNNTAIAIHGFRRVQTPLGVRP